MTHQDYPQGAVPVSAIRVMLELAESSTPVSGAARLFDMTESSHDVVRVRATDLRQAQIERARIRACRGEAAPDVLVDIEVLVASDARRARQLSTELDRSAPATSNTLRYVGTPAGLAMLISDIGAAEVADGVVLLPLPLPCVLEQIVDGTMPWLEARGLRRRKCGIEELA